MNYHRKQTTNSHHPLIKVVGIISALLGIIIVILSFKIISLKKQFKEKSQIEQNTISMMKARSHKSAKSSSTVNHVNKQPALKESQNSFQNSAPDPNSQATSTIEINNLSPYFSYSGKYAVDSSESGQVYLDFAAKKVLIMTNAVGGEQVYNFTKVLKHPDNSLVINVSSRQSYNDPTGTRTATSWIYLSILLALPGNSIQRNWQTNEPISDHTNYQQCRFSFANSNDDGKTFEMTPAYQAFVDNTPNTIFVPIN